MGVIRWLVSVDPSTWNRAVRRMESGGMDLLDRSAAERFLSDFGRDLDEQLLDGLDEADDEALRSEALNSLLEAAVTDREWTLDKSLDRLATVVRALPDTKPLLKIIEFNGIDADLPEVCRLIGSGLYGCCTPENMKDCLAVAQRYPTAKEVSEALSSSPRGVLSRFFGSTEKAEAARALITEDYYSEQWMTLTEAIRKTVGRQKMLGLGMST